MTTLLERHEKKTPSKPIPAHDDALIADFRETLARVNMTAKEFAKVSGVSETILSPWQSSKYTGDVSGVEIKIQAALKRLKVTGKLQTELVETPMTRLLAVTMGRISRTGLKGIFTAPHGSGKSAAAMRYSITDPTAILLAVTRWNNTVHGVERLVMEHFSRTAWQKSGKCRGDWLTAQLIGSKRPLLVDGAENLTVSARHWLIDLASQTGSGLLFVAPKDSGVLSDERTKAVVSMQVEGEFNSDENEETIAALFDGMVSWHGTLLGVLVKHGLGRAVAVATLASDMVRTGTDGGKAIQTAALNCGCGSAQLALK